MSIRRVAILLMPMMPVMSFMYRDSSIAPLLDLRRRIKAVMDVLDSVIRNGVSLARSVELTVQCDRILRAGPVYPVTLEGFRAAPVALLVFFFVLRVISTIGLMILSIRLLIIVRMKPFVGGEIGCGRTLSFTPLQCKPHLTPGGSGVLADQARIDEEFRKAWLPYFCRSGQREASLEELDKEVGEMLADFVRRKGATAGSLDGWDWTELKVLPVAWFDGLARVLAKVAEIGVWPDGLLDAYMAMISKADGDAAPFGQRPLSAFPVVYRIWASASILHSWKFFGLGHGFLTRSPVLVVVAVPSRLGILLPWILRRCFLVLLTLILISLWQKLLNPVTLLIVVFWMGLEQFGLACLVPSCLF